MRTEHERPRKPATKRFSWQSELLDGEIDAGFAQQREPRRYPFGAFMCDQVGMFFWAHSPEERVALLAYAMPLIVFEDPEENLPITTGILALAPQLIAAKTLHTALQQQVNAILSDQCLEWFGTFDDLAFGSGAYEQAVRISFWESLERDEPKPERAISRRRLTEFGQYLGTYGF